MPICFSPKKEEEKTISNDDDWNQRWIKRINVFEWMTFIWGQVRTRWMNWSSWDNSKEGVSMVFTNFPPNFFNESFKFQTKEKNQQEIVKRNEVFEELLWYRTYIYLYCSRILSLFLFLLDWRNYQLLINRFDKKKRKSKVNNHLFQGN